MNKNNSLHAFVTSELTPACVLFCDDFKKHLRTDRDKGRLLCLGGSCVYS